MILIEGNKVAKLIKEEIAREAQQISKERGRPPHLAAVLIGHDGGSESYVNSKIKDCNEVGFISTTIKLEDDITEQTLLDTIYNLNNNDDIDGFIVQLPLPKHINEQKIIEAISPQKDVDGFHPINIGKMCIGLNSYISATPLGITLLLKHYNIATKGKKCVIIGRSNIVGRPLSILMSQKDINSTVTLVHSATENIPAICKDADIIIAAMGKPLFLTKDMVKEGVVVIDVGTTRIQSTETKTGYKLVGDVDFENVAPKCSYITPVPGGVGPMTRVALLLNTIFAAKQQYK